MATNQAKRRRHRRSFGAIRQLQSGNYQASFKDLSGSIQRAPQTYSTREAADRFLAQKQAEQIAAIEAQKSGRWLLDTNRGAIPSYQTTTRQLQQQFGKSSWLAHSEQQAAMLRGLLVELAKDHWLQLVPVQSAPQGGRPAELWAVNPKAPEIYRRL